METTATPIRRDVLWQLEDGIGLEHCRLTIEEGEATLAGTVVTVDAGVPLSISYVVACDRSWHTREAIVDVVRGDQEDPFSLHLVSDGDGNWLRRRDEADPSHDEPIPHLAGCTDVDLGFSPCTNTLPIRRLQLAVGAKAQIDAAWVEYPSFELSVLPQQYTHWAPGRYRYESLRQGFAAGLEVDDQGLVTSYQGLWQRVAPPDAER